MKKGLSILLVVVILIGICLYIVPIQTKTTKKPEEVTYLKELSEILLVMDKVFEVNEFVVEGLKCTKDYEFSQASEYYAKAEKDLQDAQENLRAHISPPNIIDTLFKNLIENYRETILVLKDNMTGNELVDLMGDEFVTYNALKHMIICFHDLYEIRIFEKFPRNLQETWEYLFLSDYVDFPGDIEIHEIYLIWTYEYFGVEELTEEFIYELNGLINQDTLGDKDINKKWCEFMEELLEYSTLGMANAVPFIFLDKAL